MPAITDRQLYEVLIVLLLLDLASFPINLVMWWLNKKLVEHYTKLRATYEDLNTRQSSTFEKTMLLLARSDQGKNLQRIKVMEEALTRVSNLPGTGNLFIDQGRLIAAQALKDAQ